MKKFILTTRDVNLDNTLLGGQCFNWIKVDGNTYYGVFQDRIIKLVVRKNFIYWCDSLGYDQYFLEHFFDTNTDYTSLLLKLCDYSDLNQAIKALGTIRILSQELEQTFISFLISQNNNIKRIKKILFNISSLIQKEIFFDNNKFFLFPSLTDIINLPQFLIKKTGVGYRDKYIINLRNEKHKLESLKSNNDINYQKKLLKSIAGVGDKVADCVLVFSLKHRNITPIDRWIKKYFKNLGTKSSYKYLSNYLSTKFSYLTAYAGQYIFEYQRNYKTIK